MLPAAVAKGSDGGLGGAGGNEDVTVPWWLIALMASASAAMLGYIVWVCTRRQAVGLDPATAWLGRGSVSAAAAAAAAGEPSVPARTSLSPRPPFDPPPAPVLRAPGGLAAREAGIGRGWPTGERHGLSGRAGRDSRGLQHCINIHTIDNTGPRVRRRAAAAGLGEAGVGEAGDGEEQGNAEDVEDVAQWVVRRHTQRYPEERPRGPVQLVDSLRREAPQRPPVRARRRRPAADDAAPQQAELRRGDRGVRHHPLQLPPRLPSAAGRARCGSVGGQAAAPPMRRGP